MRTMKKENQTLERGKAQRLPMVILRLRRGTKKKKNKKMTGNSILKHDK